MTTVKEHRRKRRNKVSIVRRHNRKDKVSAYRGAKGFSEASREKLSQKGEALPDGSFPKIGRGTRLNSSHTLASRMPSSA